MHFNPGTPGDTNEPCGNQVQACCLAGGTCTDLDVVQCGDSGGLAQGSGSTCAATSCPECVAEEDCLDGIICTIDNCDPVDFICNHTPFDSVCDNGAFCDGPEQCDLTLGCLAGSDPCPAQACNEASDSCGEATACPDGLVDGCPTDGCTWCECVGGTCNCVARSSQADLGGGNGACAIDGACDGNDRFHALNCFSNVNTSGDLGYPCESAPPTAINVDAGGPGISCIRDGVCDGNDAFHALNCFSNIDSLGNAPYPCGCQPTPQPPGGITKDVKAGSTGITLRAPHLVRPGALVEVDVYLDDALSALRGYQLHLGVSGGRSGQWELVDIEVRSRRRDYALSAARGTWRAFNRDVAQMVVGMDATVGVATPAGAYLATFVYRVPADASGTFIVELFHDTGKMPGYRTFLFTRYARLIALSGVKPARVSVSSRRERAAR